MFQAIVRIIGASPLLRGIAKIGVNKIEFISTGATITAIASEYAGAAGSNPTLSIFDELWGYTSERSRRLWDEFVQPLTRKIAARLTVTHAGFTAESELLESLYKRGVAGRKIAADLYRTNDGLLLYWSHKLKAPWQSPQWREQMRNALRPNQFLRMIENRFVTTESEFIPLADWDACVAADARPLCFITAKSQSGSASMHRCAMIRRLSSRAHGMKARSACISCSIESSSRRPTLDFERAIESSLLDLKERFDLREIRYDPWQMVSVAQRLSHEGVPMLEFPQTIPNLTEASSNLYDLIKGRNLMLYPDAAMRLALSRAVAVESGRGFRIAKEKQSHKIDVIVALAQAALGAAKPAGKPRYETIVSALWDWRSPRRRVPLSLSPISPEIRAERIQPEEM